MLFATGLALTEILTTAFFAWVVVVCGLVGALVESSYKWGFYVFGLFALFYIWYVPLCLTYENLSLRLPRTVLLGHGPRTTFNAGPGLRSGYIRGSGFLSFILILYPIGWAVSEGGNVISPTSEAVWYGVLDLILGPVFLFYLVFGLRNIDYNTFGLQSLKYTDTRLTTPSAVVPAPAGVHAPVVGATYAPGQYPKAAEAGVAPHAAAPLGTTAAAPATTAPAPLATIGEPTLAPGAATQV